MNDIFALPFDPSLLIKVPFLFLLTLYILFALVLLNKVRSLGKMVFVSHLNVTFLLDSIAFIHLLASLSLFLFSLVIL